MGWLEVVGKNLLDGKVYDDLLHPAAQELGDVAASTLKAARFVIAPIDYLAAQQDRFKVFLERVANKVPEEQLIPAAPQITGPILEHLRYLDADSVIAEMFVNLLARAVDKQRVGEAHPAFVNIVSQLSPDEAVIIKNLANNYWITAIKFPSHKHNPIERISFQLKDDLRNQLVYPDNFSMYMDHLHSLNLGQWHYQDRSPDMQERLHKLIQSFNGEFKLSDFGQLFSRACIGN